jgi:hypothetical protein
MAHSMHKAKALLRAVLNKQKISCKQQKNFISFAIKPNALGFHYSNLTDISHSGVSYQVKNK